MAAAMKKYKPDTVRAAFAEWFEHGSATVESDQGEIRAYCPICEDRNTSKSPSASFNPDLGKWHCMSCNQGGPIYKLAQDLKKERGWDIRSASLKVKHQDPEYSAAVDDRLARAGKRATPLPDTAKIEMWNTNLLSNKRALNLLVTKRGFTEQTIIEAEIGWDGDRYTIPIYDENDELVNVRRYKVDAVQSRDKMYNIPGHGTARIYGLDDLKKYKDILFSEGETDRLLAKQYLQGHNIGAVTHTAGAATFRPAWGPLFAGKRVWIAYDNDSVGQDNAKRKVARIIGAYAEAVFILDATAFGPEKGADLTDYLHKEGHSTEDLLSLMKEAEERFIGTNSVFKPLADTGKKVSLLDSMAQENQNEILELTVSVAGKQAEPYTAPKTIHATCDMSKGLACTLCPIAAHNGAAEIEIRQDDEQIYRFVDSSEERRKKLLKEITGARCSDRVEFDVPEDYHIEELLIQPSVDDRVEDESQQPVRRTAFSVSTHRSTVNEKVKLIGKNVPDPKSGKLRFMSWLNQKVELDIDHMSMTPELYARLRKFQPSDDQMPLDKCIEIAQDMAQNVTHIYGRDPLHVAYDLVWHSVLGFKVYDMVVDKGWLEMMVVGDTRTGKSEVAKRLIKHYRAGTLLSCEGMSFAGIVGGVQQIDGRWHMTWGAVPMNDRRLVVLDEVSGMADKNVIDQMSSIRSSGIAQITKISSEQASARTRLIWISNPADGSMLHDNPEVGMNAMRTVVPNNEDVARFDFVTAVAKGEVDDSVISSGFAEMHNPEFSSVDCEALVKWAWSLKRSDVIISERATREAVKAARALGQRYVADPPLIQSENVRFKILRIAAAIAARTFSCNSKYKLVVKAEHVSDAVRFLDMLYDQEAMGYARKSRRYYAAKNVADKRKNQVKSWLLQHEDDVLVTLQTVGGNTFRAADFVEFGGMTDKAAAHTVIKALVQMKMAIRKTRGDIGMSPALIEVLREIEDEQEEGEK